MDTIINTIRQYQEGLLTIDELNTKLGNEFQIQGSVKGKDFTGYDYKNQAWLQIHIS